MRQYGQPYFGLFNFAQIKRKWRFYFPARLEWPSPLPAPCTLVALLGGTIGPLHKILMPCDNVHWAAGGILRMLEKK